ncbi:MAG: Lrp/AsnC family transcriptional regulator [Thermoprotei archaeon]
MARLKRALSEELDQKIIAALKENGKVTFAELAGKLNVSASTVYNRVTKLERKGVIKGYTIVVDRSKSGKGTGAALLITVDNQASIEGVCRDLARLADVESVYEIGGESDIMALVYTDSIEEMRKLVNEKINSIKGVENVNPLVIMKTYKENGSLFLA